MFKYLKVGQYTSVTDEAEAVIDREFYRQGYIFKDEEPTKPALIKSVISPNSAILRKHTKIF